MKNYARQIMAFVMVWIAMLVLLVYAAPADAAYWKQKHIRFSATAGETLTIGDVVCIKGSDGKAYLADANDASYRPAVGVVSKGGSAAATVEITVRGVITGMTEASPGARLFLSETPGDIVTTASTNAQVIGWVMPGTAASSTTYFIDIVIPASSGAGY